MILADVLPDWDPKDSTFLTISIPSTTDPKTTCFPSNQDVLAVHKKNCEPLVLGPALAIDRMPGPVTSLTTMELVENPFMAISSKTKTFH